MNEQDKKTLKAISKDPIKTAILIAGKTLLLLELAKWGKTQNQQNKEITQETLMEWITQKTNELQKLANQNEKKDVKQ